MIPEPKMKTACENCEHYQDIGIGEKYCRALDTTHVYDEFYCLWFTVGGQLVLKGEENVDDESN